MPIRSLFPGMIKISDFPCRLPPHTPCWIWLGAKDGEGDRYGSVAYEGKRHRVHRLSLRLSKKEPLPREAKVCHRCDVKLCCNPEHLYAGTNDDNSKDRFRGLLACTPEVVAEIKASKYPQFTEKLLAQRYRLTKLQVRASVRGGF